MRGMLGPLPNLSVLRVAEAYSELDPLDRPLVTTMGMSATKPLVESEFGLVQRGSILSCQHPKLHSKKTLSDTTTPHPVPAFPWKPTTSRQRSVCGRAQKRNSCTRSA